jgi:hypothetical protein
LAVALMTISKAVTTPVSYRYSLITSTGSPNFPGRDGPAAATSWPWWRIAERCWSSCWTRSGPRGWPADLDVSFVPPLVRELASRGLWLEQEPIVLDRRIPAELQRVLAGGPS